LVAAVEAQLQVKEAAQELLEAVVAQVVEQVKTEEILIELLVLQDKDSVVAHLQLVHQEEQEVAEVLLLLEEMEVLQRLVVRAVTE
jgi:hypothetical protein